MRIIGLIKKSFAAAAIATVCILGCAVLSTSAKPAWETEMAEFRQQDAEHPPQSGRTLFVGSSTFRMWKTMQEDMPEIPLINRSFGGSKVSEVIEHFDTVIAPYNPCHIVLYEGDNDTAGGLPAGDILKNYKKLLEMIWGKYPDVEVTIVSVKPCESRRSKIEATQQINQMLSKWADETERLYYLDTYNVTVNGEGNPIPEYFLADKLHLNKSGYAAWTRKIAQHLKERGIPMQREDAERGF